MDNICNKCGKIYTTRQHLHRHRKKCLSQKIIEDSNNRIFENVSKTEIIESKTFEDRDDKIVLPLELPFTCVVSGQTGCGKTEWIYKLLKSNMFDKPVDKILFCYSIFQDIYKKMMNDIHNLELHEGIPDEFPSTPNHSIILFDDLMLEAANDKKLAAAFSKMRHNNLSTIFVTQNLYHEGKYMRTITRNAQYLILFPNFRDKSMICTLGRQMWPTKPAFLPSAFEQACKKPYGYLFLDLKSGTDDNLRVRESIFPEDEQIYVYA